MALSLLGATSSLAKDAVDSLKLLHTQRTPFKPHALKAQIDSNGSPYSHEAWRKFFGSEPPSLYLDKRRGGSTNDALPDPAPNPYGQYGGMPYYLSGTPAGLSNPYLGEQLRLSPGQQ
jgi:hypothetical protein